MTDAASKPWATIRATPEDFLVEEIPAYEPSGAGEHLYVRFRKRGLTTLQAVDELARRLGVGARDAGTAGLKDRHAVTVQTASFPWPLTRALPEADALGAEGLEVLALARHGNKLRTGHLRGNRFVIVLRDLDPAGCAALAAAFERLGEASVPNWYGPQRFGRDGDNAERARAWLSGRAPAPRQPRVRRLQFSALQSELFHRVLERRVADGTWREPLEGDLVQREGGGPLRSWPIVERRDAGAGAGAAGERGGSAGAGGVGEGSEPAGAGGTGDGGEPAGAGGRGAAREPTAAGGRGEQSGASDRVGRGEDFRMARGEAQAPEVGARFAEHGGRGPAGREAGRGPGDERGGEAFGVEEDDPWRPTGPMFGSRMKWPAGAAEALEREVLGAAVGDAELFDRWSSLGEGARRPLALTPRRVRAGALAEGSGSLRVEFVLPKGAYATTVLGALCQLRDASFAAGPGGAAAAGGAAAGGESHDRACEEEQA